MARQRASRLVMTILYSGDVYHLADDSVTIQVPGGSPRVLDPDSLPLPVARTLLLWRASPRT